MFCCLKDLSVAADTRVSKNRFDNTGVLQLSSDVEPNTFVGARDHLQLRGNRRALLLSLLLLLLRLVLS